jgi:uroporphyrinogen decarboxylase
MADSLLTSSVTPNWEGLRACILREGTPDRVYNIELFLDTEVQDAICDRYGLLEDLDPADPFFAWRKQIIVQSFLGYDFVRCSLENQEFPLRHHRTKDTASLSRSGGREFMDLQVGPITNWDEFEAYPWPDLADANTDALEWLAENLPENMCVMGSGGFAHFAELLSWLMGYETFCIALLEQRDLVDAIAQRLFDYYDAFLIRLLEFDRVKIIWGSDDMGFRGGPLMAPDDMRSLVLKGHKSMAQLSHDAGRPYLLHSCGKLDLIMDDLIDDVGIDAKHSFEDTIEDVISAYGRYGSRVTMLGGIDVDFLCRKDEAAVRQRVRKTLEACHEGGGYCLGTGNSVANYIPLDNYLAMLDEGRKFTAL